MRTVAATRQAPRADLTSAPKSLTWLVYCRENKLLTASEWALAAILVTLGEGQNITLSITGMADILHMRRDTVAKAIDGLIAKGLMVVKGHGRSNKTFYRLTLPLSHCRNEDQSTAQMGTSDCPNEDQSTAQMGTTTSTSDKDLQQQLTSTSARGAEDDDVVGGSPSGKNRAKASSRSASTTRSKGTARAKGDPGKDFPSVEDYIADIEGCIDDLAGRLGIDPGLVTIKPLAKMWRKLMVQYDDRNDTVSSLLEIVPATDPKWSLAASKDNPVGFLMFIVEKMLQGHDITAPARVPAPVQDRAEIEDQERAEREQAELQERAQAAEAEVVLLAERYAGLTGRPLADIQQYFSTHGPELARDSLKRQIQKIEAKNAKAEADARAKQALREAEAEAMKLAREWVPTLDGVNLDGIRRTITDVPLEFYIDVRTLVARHSRGCIRPGEARVFIQQTDNGPVLATDK